MSQDTQARIGRPRYRVLDLNARRGVKRHRIEGKAAEVEAQLRKAAKR